MVNSHQSRLLRVHDLSGSVAGVAWKKRSVFRGFNFTAIGFYIRKRTDLFTQLVDGNGYDFLRMQY